MITKDRLCKCGCRCSIAKKHPNAKFLNQKHKDTYWNTVNPRGMYAHLNHKSENYDPEYDRHPFDLED